MQQFEGKSVYNGIAMGPVVLFRKRQQEERKRIEYPDAEILRLEQALQASKQQLSDLYNKAVSQVGKDSADIFEVHRMMLEDEDYLEAVRDMIYTESVNAEYAVCMTGNKFSEMFASMEDEYMKARAADILDISDRIARNLSGHTQEGVALSEPSVIVAEDLSPSETMQLEKEKVLAFVTVHGSTNSHTAILARMMNIPAIVGVSFSLENVQDGEIALVDGFKGKVTFAPDEQTRSYAEGIICKEKEETQLLQNLKGKENVTLDGRKIEIYANIGSVSDIGHALENDAGGIGLFRSEFLYLGRENYPSEEEQFEAYKQAADMMAGRKVIIRTLDIGADKQAQYFGIDKEENPAMGYRAIRICLTRPEIFRTQLRAVFRAAYYGNISIMYPMIISTDEVTRILAVVDDVKQELDKQGIPYKVPKQGIMIETPAAVMISDKLAQMVDFFSIGTNDLTQYTLAIDRQNESLGEFYNPHHEAVLRMIKLVVDNAHQYGKWVGICGELAADLELTEQFLDMGVDELSVAPSMVLKLRKKVREIR